MNSLFEWLGNEDPRTIRRVANALSQAERNEFAYHWEMQARPAQLPPKGAWRTWLIMARRGFGKTRAGTEWVRMIAETHPEARIVLVATSLAEAQAVMVEGESGLLACSPAERRPTYEASLKRITFPNGVSMEPKCSSIQRLNPKACAARNIAMPGVTKWENGRYRIIGLCAFGTIYKWACGSAATRASR